MWWYWPKTARRGGKHRPLFAVTALAMSGDKELVLQAGFDGYLTKPVCIR